MVNVKLYVGMCKCSVQYTPTLSIDGEHGRVNSTCAAQRPDDDQGSSGDEDALAP